MKLQNNALLLDVEIRKVKSLTSILPETRLEQFSDSFCIRRSQGRKKRIKNTEQVMREAAAKEISADSAAVAV